MGGVFTAEGAVQRDIVLVMTDQQRHDQVGYASGGFFETPVLDSLAAAGVRFDTAYSASTTCVQARTSLLTGVQSIRLPWSDHWPALAPGTWTVAHAMRAAGYETALIGKMHFTPVHADHGFDHMRMAEHLAATTLALGADGAIDVDDYHQSLVDAGLGTWADLQPGKVSNLRPLPVPGLDPKVPFPYDIEHHATTWIEREVEAFLDQRTGDRPLFLVISFLHPHTPVNPLGPYADLYDPADTVLPGEGLDAVDGLPKPFRDAFVGKNGFFDPWRVDVFGEDALRTHLTGVRALIRQIDDTLGRLLPRFDLDRTTIAFTSDHGDYAGHRGVGMKMPWMPFEDLVRVPLVVAGAGVAGGRTVAEPVQVIDLARTFCELAGIEVEHEAFDSTSMADVLAGTRRPDPERPVLLGAWGWPGVRRGSSKLFQHPASGEVVLFDLDDDPGERVDRSRDPARAAELEDLVAALAQMAGPALESFWPAGTPAPGVGSGARG